jgi:hypothetical protein
VFLDGADLVVHEVDTLSEDEVDWLERLPWREPMVPSTTGAP